MDLIAGRTVSVTVALTSPFLTVKVCEVCRSGADGILALRVGELFEALGVRRLVLHLKELVRIKIVADNDLEVRLHGGSIDLRRLCILDIDHEVAGDRLAGDVIPIADGQRVCALRRPSS